MAPPNFSYKVEKLDDKKKKKKFSKRNTDKNIFIK